jgi:hypothetical protein
VLLEKIMALPTTQQERTQERTAAEGIVQRRLRELQDVEGALREEEAKQSKLDGDLRDVLAAIARVKRHSG